MKLFVYEHCPYCVRVRVALALKGIDCDIEYLRDDDITGHVDKIGVKNVPILQKNDGTYMGESLDIIDYIDGLLGDKIFMDKTINSEIESLYSEIRLAFSALVFSYTHLLNFPEIDTEASKKYYVNRFLNKLPYDTLESLVADRENLKQKVAPYLEKISMLLNKDSAMVGNTMGINEVLLFSPLFTITAVEDIILPQKLSVYLNTVMQHCNIKALSEWK